MGVVYATKLWDFVRICVPTGYCHLYSRKLVFSFVILVAAMLMFILLFYLLLVSGGTFGSSSREPKYKIEFHTEDSPFHPVSAFSF